MFETQNMHMTAFLLTVTQAKLVDLRRGNGEGKTFVLSGEETDYRSFILNYFNGEKFNVSPRELFQKVKSLKSLIYDGGSLDG